jgi:peptide/nickel transport system substrate-binding protein
MQHLVDQTLLVKRIDKNYGAPNYGVIPDLPDTPFLSPTAKKNPYPYSVSAAMKLLSSHGWKVVATGTDTCVKPGTGKGDCGKGIKKGAKLSFTMSYSTQPSNLKEINEALKASWAEAGIQVKLTSGAFNAVYSAATPCKYGSNCSWELADWGAWLFSPDIYPAGTELLAAGAGSNSGSWPPAGTTISTTLITKTETGTTTLFKYEDFMEKNLPYVIENSGTRLYEIHKGLEGVAPMDPLATLTPATFHWT